MGFVTGEEGGHDRGPQTLSPFATAGVCEGESERRGGLVGRELDLSLLRRRTCWVKWLRMSRASFCFPAMVNSCFDFRTFRSIEVAMRSDIPALRFRALGLTTFRV